MTEQEKKELLDELEKRIDEKYKGCLTREEVWETIRKLTCVICGKQYVRQLANVENADEIAEKLCQFVYDLKIDFKKQEDAKC